MEKEVGAGVLEGRPWKTEMLKCGEFSQVRLGILKVSLRRPVPLAQPTGPPFFLPICSYLVYFNGDFTFTYVNSAPYLSISWLESLSRF